MMSTKSVTVLVLLVIYIQNIEGNADGEIKPFALATRERDLRGIRDTWDQVKRNAISLWNFLKKVAENTRNQISKRSNSAKEYAANIEKTFEQQLLSLHTGMRDVITNFMGTGHLIKKCLKDEGKNVQIALVEILKKLSECVINQIKQLSQMKGKHAQLIRNETVFMTELDNKLEACKADKTNYEECLYMVRELVYDELEEMDDQIQQTDLESRSLADDIKNSLTECSLKNLAGATLIITSEIMDVVKCVLDGKGINKAILEEST